MVEIVWCIWGGWCGGGGGGGVCVGFYLALGCFVGSGLPVGLNRLKSESVFFVRFVF